MGPSKSAVEAFLDRLLVDIADFGYRTVRFRLTYRSTDILRRSRMVQERTSVSRPSDVAFFFSLLLQQSERSVHFGSGLHGLQRTVLGGGLGPSVMTLMSNIFASGPRMPHAAAQ
jgi:hypothetical protein